MARIRRYGYVVEWFIGDHVPRHVHVYDSDGRLIGRLGSSRQSLSRLARRFTAKPEFNTVFSIPTTGDLHHLTSRIASRLADLRYVAMAAA